MNAQAILDTALRAKEQIDNSIDYIPNSWVDDSGVRHAVVQEPLMEDRMRLVKVGSKWELQTEVPF